MKEIQVDVSTYCRRGPLCLTDVPIVLYSISETLSSFSFGWWGSSSLFEAWGKSSIWVAIIILHRKNKKISQFQYKPKLTPSVNVCKLRALKCMFIALLRRTVSLERRTKWEKRKRKNFGLLSSQVKNIKKRKWHNSTAKKRMRKMEHFFFQVNSNVNLDSIRTCRT